MITEDQKCHEDKREEVVLSPVLKMISGFKCPECACIYADCQCIYEVVCDACSNYKVADALQWMRGLDEHGFAEYITRPESKIVVHRIESKAKWISVKNRLPDIYLYVIVLEETSGTSEPKPISIARRIPKNYLGHEWDFLAMNDDSVGAYMDISYPIDSSNITHWMPLPSPPTN